MDKRRRSIQILLLSSQIIVVIIMALVGGLILYSQKQVVQLGKELYIHPFTVSNAALDARLAASSIRNNIPFAVMSRSLSEVAKAEDHVRDLDANLKGSLDTIEAAFLGDMNAVKEAQRLMQEWRPVRQQIFALAHAGEFEAASAIIVNDATRIYDEIVKRLDYIVGFARQKAGVFAQEAESQADMTWDIASGLLGIGALVAVALGLLVTRSALRLLDRQQAQLQEAASVFSGTADAVAITDCEGKIVRINAAFTQITGFTSEEAIGQMPKIIKSYQQSSEFYQELWNNLLEQGQWQGQIWNRRKNGEAFLAWETITAIRDREGQIIRFVSVFSDITETHRKDEQIRHQAHHDPLTGLPNRILLQHHLGQAIEMARRHQTELALLFIDLNRFKIINDSLGHDVGDLLLVEIAHRIRGVLRRSDLVARMGGDEFVIVLPDLGGPVEATEVAEKLQQAIRAPLQLQGYDLHIGASIGIALFPYNGEDSISLMKNADLAMYQAKQSGSDSFRFFTPAMNDRVVEWLELEEALRQAIERREFLLLYQPKIDLHSGATVGVEALIRWNRPGAGVISPGQFIPLAEEIGFIDQIGDWVIGEACRQIAAWRDKGLTPLRVAVNVSTRQFLDPHFGEKIRSYLEQFGVSPSLLEVELTESAVMTDPKHAIRQILDLQQMGVVTSVDDFGTGYSSLSYLKRLPIASVKVDQSFVRNVHTDPDNAAIASAIQGMADALGLSTVAEGIESDAEEHHMKTLGYPVGQGFKYSVPLMPEELERWLKGLNML